MDERGGGVVKAEPYLPQAASWLVGRRMNVAEAVGDRACASGDLGDTDWKEATIPIMAISGARHVADTNMTNAFLAATA